jgi:molecular chaperone HtpG
VRWISGGAGDFEVETIDRAARGTSVILHLRDDAMDYLNAWKLKQHHRQVLRPHQPAHPDGKGRVERRRTDQPERRKGGRQPGAMVKTGEWETVNKASAMWTRPKKDITEEQYESSTSRSATTLRRRWPGPQPRGRQHRVHAAAVHPRQGAV